MIKRVTLDTSTVPESWKEVYYYDNLEIYGNRSVLGHTYAYNNRRQVVIDFIKRFQKTPAKILDIAAAQGNYTLWLAELGYDVTWNDLRSDLVPYVKEKYEVGNVTYAPGNVFELGFEEDFDIVLIAEIIEHVAHPDDFLRKVSKFVKPGGYIVMTTPNGGYFRNHLPRFSDCHDPSQFEAIQFSPNSDGHIFLLHTDEVEVLSKQAGLNLLALRLYTNSLTNGHVKLGLLLKYIPLSIVRGIESLTQKLPLFLQRKLNTGMAVVMQRVS